MAAQLQFDPSRLAEICRRHHIRRLALFGSVLYNHLRSDSDVDLLAEFDPDHRPGMVGMYEIEQEFSRLFGSRKIDLINPKYLNPRIRERVLSEPEVQFAEG
jgi:hypothetical protein